MGLCDLGEGMRYGFARTPLFAFRFCPTTVYRRRLLCVVRTRAGAYDATPSASPSYYEAFGAIRSGELIFWKGARSIIARLCLTRTFLQFTGGVCLCLFVKVFGNVIRRVTRRFARARNVNVRRFAAVVGNHGFCPFTNFREGFNGCVVGWEPRERLFLVRFRVSLVRLNGCRCAVKGNGRVLALFRRHLPMFLFFSKLAKRFTTVRGVDSRRSKAREELRIICRDVDGVLLRLLRVPLYARGFRLTRGAIRRRRGRRPGERGRVPCKACSMTVQVLRRALCAGSTILLRQCGPKEGVLVFYQNVSYFRRYAVKKDMMLTSAALVNRSRNFRPKDGDEVRMLRKREGFRSTFVSTTLRGRDET